MTLGNVPNKDWIGYWNAGRGFRFSSCARHEGAGRPHGASCQAHGRCYRKALIKAISKESYNIGSTEIKSYSACEDHASIVAVAACSA
jgi:hypothetical protein